MMQTRLRASNNPFLRAAGFSLRGHPRGLKPAAHLRGAPRGLRPAARRVVLRSLVAVSPLVTPVSALAAGEEHGGGSVSPFAGDIGSAIWTLIIFILVVFVLGKFAWGPILRALQKREDFIKDSLEQAQKHREEAEARLKEYAEKLETARAEATAIVDEARRDAEVVKRKIDEDARVEAAATLERAKREIGIATDTAVKELYTLSAKLATDAASRIIRRELDAKGHERLIAESIEELQEVGCN
ncbi:MAG: F0F1 ATP synthase subunit B [Phycisphaerae bacterium]